MTEFPAFPVYSTETLLTRVRALRIQHQKRARAYAAECEEDYRMGYAPHYCIHGTNLWVDYDNICMGCEEGLTESYYENPPIADLLDMAKSEFLRDSGDYPGLITTFKYREIQNPTKEDVMELLNKGCARFMSMDMELLIDRINIIRNRWGF